MARIAGVNIPVGKRIETSLTYLYGVGASNVVDVLKQASITGNPRVKDMSEDEIERIRQVVDKNVRVEGDLRQVVTGNIKRLKEIGSFRGSRHAKNLPVRGQRTKTNSRTKRGNKRVTVGSGRKSAAQKT